MPYSFSADDEARLISIRYFGEATFRDIGGSSRDAVEQGRPNYRLLADMREVTRWHVSTKDLRVLAREFVSGNPGFSFERAEIIAPNDAVYDVRAWIAVTVH